MTNTFNRRVFLGTTAAAAASLAAPVVFGQTGPRVVVIGGGTAGGTVARYLATQYPGAMHVTLVEPTRTYYTCYFSNLYLGGFWPLDGLAHSYGRIAAAGVNVVHESAVGVDRDSRTVTLSGGYQLSYDRLIVAPGIDFVEDSIPGWDLSAQNRMPHAYKAGSQTELLKSQVENMREGGVFALVAPPNPFRCPPGPYERVSMVAHLLSQRNPTARILLVDPKPSFSKQTLFEEGWQRYYPGMIERVGPEFGADNVSVDPQAMEIDIDGMIEQVDVCNVIPAQKAGHIAALAGLTNEAGWAPVTPEDMRSRMDPEVFVLGDASAQGEMPKSAFAANSQARVVANVVANDLIDAPLYPARYANTCWSLIAPEDGVRVGAAYAPIDDQIAATASFVSQPGESAAQRAATYRESISWYNAVVADIFG